VSKQKEKDSKIKRINEIAELTIEKLNPIFTKGKQETRTHTSISSNTTADS